MIFSSLLKVWYNTISMNIESLILGSKKYAKYRRVRDVLIETR